MDNRNLFKSYVNICKITDSIEMEYLIHDLIEDVNIDILKKKYKNLNGIDLENAAKLKNVFGENSVKDYCDIYNNYHAMRGGSSLFRNLSSTFKKIDAKKIQSFAQKISDTSIKIAKAVGKVAVTIIKKFFKEPDGILSVINKIIAGIFKESFALFLTSIVQHPEQYDKLVDQFVKSIQTITEKVNNDLNNALASMNQAKNIPGIGPMIVVLTGIAIKFNNIVKAETDKLIGLVMMILATGKELLISGASESGEDLELMPVDQLLRGLTINSKNRIVAEEIAKVFREFLDLVKSGIVGIINYNKKTTDSIIVQLEKLVK